MGIRSKDIQTNDLRNLKFRPIITTIHDRISANRNYSYFVDSFRLGNLYTAGSNDHGQMGTTTDIGTLSGHELREYENESLGTGKIVACEAGLYHGLFLGEYGAVYTTGSNEFNQCGFRTDEENLTGYDGFVQFKRIEYLEDQSFDKIRAGQFTSFDNQHQG